MVVIFAVLLDACAFVIVSYFDLGQIYLDIVMELHSYEGSHYCSQILD
jgi:hypothetical protein